MSFRSTVDFYSQQRCSRCPQQGRHPEVLRVSAPLFISQPWVTEVPLTRSTRRQSTIARQAQRFSVSSNPTIKTAVSHWEQFAFEHGLELLVENGDPIRGGVMASFALYLARKNSRMEKFSATFGAWRSTILTTASIHLWTMFKIGPGGCVRWMFKSTHLHVLGFHVLWSSSAIHVFNFLLQLWSACA